MPDYRNYTDDQIIAEQIALDKRADDILFDLMFESNRPDGVRPETAENAEVLLAEIAEIGAEVRRRGVER
jgi:hypothetical protein